MKIYDWHIAPNPRRLHIYLAEKGLTVDLVEVGQEDLTLAPWFKQQYPHAMVPVLELDDGRRSARQWRSRSISRRRRPGRS